MQKIVRLTSKRFPEFAKRVERVDIQQIIRFILAKRSALESARRKKTNPGNDARDISYTAWLLKPLTSKALDTIQQLKQSEIRQQLRNSSHPFSLLSREAREKLLHLPISWIRESADWQLDIRKSKTADYRRKLDGVKKMMEERFSKKR